MGFEPTTAQKKDVRTSLAALPSRATSPIHIMVWMCSSYSSFFIYGVILTLVPFGTRDASSRTSLLCMRIQPKETAFPIEEGLLVP